MDAEVNEFKEALSDAETLKENFIFGKKMEIERWGPIKVDGVLRNCSILRGLKVMHLASGKVVAEDAFVTDETADTISGLFESITVLANTGDTVTGLLEDMDELKSDKDDAESEKDDLQEALDVKKDEYTTLETSYHEALEDTAKLEKEVETLELKSIEDDTKITTLEAELVRLKRSSFVVIPDE